MTSNQSDLRFAKRRAELETERVRLLSQLSGLKELRQNTQGER